ncbi:MAG: hypothetical protein KatS3mg004_1373 [Bryobacteraceae bacterium]|nr:MAG: hypothetical protein KatS3mg004_1373 [Bryobacteraceae bacterium]
MPQPWDEPSEPFEGAEERLPLAGLLAELLAGADTVNQPQAAASTAPDPQELPDTPVSLWVETQPGPLEAPDLLRALGEAQVEETREDLSGTSSQLLARLLDEEGGGLERESGKQVDEAESAAPLVAGEGAHEFVAPPSRIADSELSDAADEGISPSTGEAGANASEPAVPLPLAQAAKEPPGSSAMLPLQAAGPVAGSEPQVLGALAEPAWLAAVDVPQAACAPEADALAKTVEGEPGDERRLPAEPESAAAPRAGRGVAEPEPAAAAGSEMRGRLALADLPALAGSEVEEDEFELVDAETAGRFLDQLIDAARSAIQGSLHGSGHAAMVEAAPAEAGNSQLQPAPGREPEPPVGSLPNQAATAARESRPVFESRGVRPFSVPEAGELGEEPPPLPPAVALIGMGLPERLRARLESLGNVERVLAEMAAAAPAKAMDQRRRLLVFRVGAEYYGLPVEHVREVDRVDRLTPVPGAPAFVRGLINLRGEILPLVDMRLLLGGEGGEMPGSARLIVAQAHAEEAPLALMVEELNGLAPVDEAPESVGAEGERPGRGIRGSLEHRGHRVWWLDPGAVLGQAALEELAGQP